MSVSRPQHDVVAEGVSRALVMHDVTFLEVWSALTILEPPIAEAAARARTAEDLAAIVAAADRFVALTLTRGLPCTKRRSSFVALDGRRTTRCSVWRKNPLLQLLEPSLQVMIDKVAQARSRIVTAQKRIVEALEARDAEGARTWMAKTHPRLPQRIRDR